jgi:ribose transport system substrate-binding protein
MTGRNGRRAALGALGVGMCAAVAACGSSSSDNSSSSAKTTTSNAAAGGAKMSVAMIGALSAAGNDFVFAQYCGAQQAAKKLGVELKFQAPTDYSAPDQIKVLRSVMATKPKAIIIEPDDSAALQAPLDEAMNQGIKVIILDTVTKDMSKVSAAVVTDDAQAGKAAAESLTTLTGGKGTVVAFGQSPGFSTTEARLKGFSDSLSGSGLNVLKAQYTEGSVNKAQTITAGLIARTPDLAGMLDTGGTSYLGIQAALKRANATSKIKVLAFDADRTRVAALKSGVISGIVSQKIVTEGQLGVEYAVKALKGEAVPAMTKLPTMVVTKDNVDSPEAAPFVYSHTCDL